MIIEIQYENTRQQIEVDVEDAAKWLNISMDEKDIEKKIQEKVNEKYNKPEYNIVHKQDRHRTEIESTDNENNVIWRSKGKEKYCEKIVNEPEDIYDHANDKSVFSQHEDKYAKEQAYEFCCNLIKQYLKPGAATIVIFILLDDYTAREVAEVLGDTPNNISHKYRRALKKLSKVLDKNVLLERV